jgi:hypothetical protein
MEWNDLQAIQSKILVFNFDPMRYQSLDENQTIVTYSLIGVNDFGLIIQTIRIWQQLIDLDHLILVQLKDDIRQWNEQYQPSSVIDRYYPNRILLYLI